MPSFRSGRSAAEVDSSLRRSIHELRAAERNAVLWFADLLDRRLYRELGYSSIRHYATERLGFSRSKTWQFLRLARSLERLPRLRESVARGELPWTKALVVSSVATPRTEARWVASAREMGRRELAAKARRARERTRGGARKGSGSVELFAGGGTTGETQVSAEAASREPEAGVAGSTIGARRDPESPGSSTDGYSADGSSTDGYSAPSADSCSEAGPTSSSHPHLRSTPDLLPGSSSILDSNPEPRSSDLRFESGSTPDSHTAPLPADPRLEVDSLSGTPAPSPSGLESDPSDDDSPMIDEEPAAPVEVRFRLSPEEYARYEALLEVLGKNRGRREPARLLLAALEALTTAETVRAGTARAGTARAGTARTGTGQAGTARAETGATTAVGGADESGASVECSRLHSHNSNGDRGLKREPDDGCGTACVGPMDGSTLASSPSAAAPANLPGAQLPASPRRIPPPTYQVYVRLCERCDRGWAETSGGPKLLDFATLRTILCDARVSRHGEPNRSTIPPRIRRAVLERDGYRCRVRGCGSRRFLQVHHLASRSDGGPNGPDNLIALCAPCHRMLHGLRGTEAVLTDGPAPDGADATGRAKARLAC